MVDFNDTAQERLLPVELQAEVTDELMSRMSQAQRVKLFVTMITRAEHDFQVDVLRSVFESMATEKQVALDGMTTWPRPPDREAGSVEWEDAFGGTPSSNGAEVDSCGWKDG